MKFSRYLGNTVLKIKSISYSKLVINLLLKKKKKIQDRVPRISDAL